MHVASSRVMPLTGCQRNEGYDPFMARLGGGLALTVAAACLLVAAAPATAAEVFDVDSTNDAIDANVTDDVCATAGGKCTLRAAIAQANETAGNDIINVPKGTFKLKIPKAGGMTIPSNQEGDLQVEEAVSIDGRGPEKTVIKQTIEDRVLTNLAGGLPGAQLSDLTVTGGRVTAPGNQFGGGLFNQGTLALNGVVVRGNEVVPKPAANSFGGGIFQDDGLLLISQSTIAGNLVEVKSPTGSAVGGGISTNDGVLGIQSSRISGNVAREIGDGNSVGGGISFRGPSSITNTTISGNRAMEGAGIEVSLSTNDGILNLDSSTVSGNEGKQGGGIYLRSDETHTIINSTISGNSAPKGGAGIYERIGDTDVTHSTIFRNPARRKHAGVEASEFATAIDFAGSIVAGKGRDCRAKPPAVIEANAQNVFGDATCSSGISTDIVAKPKLEDLAANPGPSPGVPKTHALRDSSPALDFVSACPPPAFDERGVPRPGGIACDAGSFEAEG